MMSRLPEITQETSIDLTRRIAERSIAHSEVPVRHLVQRKISPRDYIL